MGRWHDGVGRVGQCGEQSGQPCKESEGMGGAGRMGGGRSGRCSGLGRRVCGVGVGGVCGVGEVAKCLGGWGGGGAGCRGWGGGTHLHFHDRAGEDALHGEHTGQHRLQHCGAAAMRGRGGGRVGEGVGLGKRGVAWGGVREPPSHMALPGTLEGSKCEKRKAKWSRQRSKAASSSECPLQNHEV
jgi:hypothetical protein